MCRKLMSSVLVVFLLGLVNSADAGVTVIQCDVGGCGPLQAGWISLDSCGTYTDVGGTGINVTLATGNPGACACRNPGGSDALAEVEWDLLFADDEVSTPGGDFIITFSNLIPGTSYCLLSFHNRSDEGASHIEGVVVTGATNVTAPDRITQDHAIMDNPAEIFFVAGAGDVSIRYIAPTEAEAGKGAQAFLNGFILEITGPVIQFETASSGAPESVSPAILTVVVSNPEAGETYTADYAAAGGTAVNGEDYILAADTLTFEPGITSQQIPITIINDGVDEDDETIIVELSNPTGGIVVLGAIAQHTYAILDPRAGVGFDTAAGSDAEDVTAVNIAVSLSAAMGSMVTVDYAVTGGTATGGGADYTLLGDGTLEFAPGVITQYISIAIVDDSIEEVPDETIELTLSNPSSNVKLAVQNQHTYTIIDNEEGVRWDGLTWYYSEDPPSALFVNQDGQLEWSPEGEEQFITRLPEQDFSYTGAVVEISYFWMSDGEGHESHPECEIGCQRNDEGCPCDYDDDIQCLAGTSDFRVGLFEADGEYITDDGFDVSSSIFEGYKGYGWRFGPHMDSYPTYWRDCDDEAHKTGQFQKKPISLSDLLSTNAGLSSNDDPIPGFELPPGEFSLFTVRLERLSSSEVELSIMLNDRTYTWVDDDDDDQPQKIDVLAVHMRNHRPYSRLVLESLAPPPPPQPASSPIPADGAEGVDPNVVLGWTPGTDMLSHDVYLGTSSDDVNNANIFSDEFKGRQSPDANSFALYDLELNATYYWRIDEVNNGSTWRSDVWSFTVANCVVVDEMESYNDSTNIITDTWRVKPYPDDDNGALAFLEQTIVHGGEKSMKFIFSTWEGTYFTATRIYSTAQNWNVRGVNHLALWFYGDSGNTADDQMYVLVKDDSGHSATVTYDGDANDITEQEWHEWNIRLQDFNDGGVNLTDVSEVVIGVDSLFWVGTIYFDDIRLYPTRCLTQHISVADLSGDCVVDFKDLAILGNQWRQSPGSPSADIAEPLDGFVNWKDLDVLTDYWLEVTLWPPEE